MDNGNKDGEYDSSSSSEGDYRNRVAPRAPRFAPRPPPPSDPNEPVASTSTGATGAAGQAGAAAMPPNHKGGVEILSPLRLPSHNAPPRRMNNFKNEKERLESFAGFPAGRVDVRQLAKAGFWYTKSEDIVRCAFCNVEVGRWEEGDDPMEEHKKWSKNCSFLKPDMDSGNIGLSDSDCPPLPPLENLGYDECGIYNIKKSDSCPMYPSLEKLGIQKRYTPAHPSYATLEARLESFSCWPIGLKHRPQELAEAGFFYTGLGDKTICFQCGGGLKDWAETDEPWREHALYFSKCSFIVQTKGREFIAEVLGKKPPTLTPEEIRALAIPEEFSNVVQQHNNSGESTSSSCSTATDVSPSSLKEKIESAKPVTASPSAKRLDDARACKICFSDEIGVAFLPCGHLVSCVNCVSSLTTCAVCRKPFSATVRVFLS